MMLKREPAMIAVAVLAVLNLVLGRDSGLTVEAVETVVLLVSGLVLRSRVTPARK